MATESSSPCRQALFRPAREGLPTVYEGQAYQLTRLAKTTGDFLEEKPDAAEKPAADGEEAGNGS